VKRVLAIAPQPFYSPRGTPLSVYYRTLVMAECGAKIDLLTYGEGQDVDLANVRIVRIPRLSFLGPVKVGPSFLKAFLDVFMMIWTIGMLLRRRYDVVHAHEEAVFWCSWLKPIFRFKLVYDMHSSLPQQLTNFRFSGWKPLIRIFERLEKAALRRSDAVITICPDLKNYALEQGVEPGRHFLIENSIFESIQLKQDELLDEIVCAGSIASKRGPRVVYAGTFEPYQGIDILIRAFGLVQARRADLELLLIGGAPAQVQRMKALAEAEGLNGQCIFTGRVPKEAAAQYTSTADVLVSPRRDGTNTPLKVYEQLASGKPLVATDIWSHTQILSKDVCILVQPEPASMAEGILQAVQDWPRSMELAAAARRLYEMAYSREVYEQKIRKLMELLA
jgi:glycosyltransferase involved in cell wall biosynthesis